MKIKNNLLPLWNLKEKQSIAELPGLFLQFPEIPMTWFMLIFMLRERCECFR